jgi:pyridinium-3,5-biscarboxylic acid mononucleotide synthase
MLNSCSSGITVVNVDNGYGAACAATLIIKAINKGARR